LWLFFHVHNSAAESGRIINGDNIWPMTDRRCVAVLVSVFLLAPSLSSADTALLVALPPEQSALSREVRLVGQPMELALHKVSIGYHKGEKLYIVRTGAGNLNSAMVTQALLARYRIDRVISIGVAGNLNDDWKVGDIFVPTDVVNHQEGKETPVGFEPNAGEEKPALIQSRCEALQSNAVVIARTTLTNEIPRQARNDSPVVRQGLLVSGDSFIASTAKRKWLRETFHADAVDMVSAGIARVCEANGVPYVIIRTLSDNADESAAAAFTKFVQSGKETEPVTVPIALRLIEQVAAPHP
jgi:adenosylhomocysteine nucleosidase